uniref:Uncharacterized protein n=1 Tax=viral metagenome TaxID=1070528 RepID=A0A6M3M8U4_9ZZZZ
MAVATLKEFNSPLTGRLTLYQRHDWLGATEGRSVIDVDFFKDDLNNNFYNQNIDAVCTDVRHMSSAIVDFVEVETWVSLDSLQASGTGKAGIAVIAVIGALIWKIVIAAVVIGAVICVAGFALHTWRMNEAYPNLYFTLPDPETGEVYGPWPRETVATWNASTYPNLWIDPNTTMALDPTDPQFAERKEFIITNTPSGWGEPQSYPFDLSGIMPYILLGALALGGILILPSLIKAFRSKD